MPFEEKKIIYYAICSSTNTVAMNLATNSKIKEGTVVITDCQLQGRGQRDNTWISIPYQNLTFSLILYPTWLEAKDSFWLNMITTLGIYQALISHIPSGLFIKWPNDIYIQDKKVCGILIESIVNKSKLRVSVIGIGLNVNQTSFNNFPHATSLSLMCSGYKFNLSSLLMQLTYHIQKQYNRLHHEGVHNIQADYLQHLYGLHETKTFRDQQGTFQGVIQGIDQEGRLIVGSPHQEPRHYNSQEIGLVL